MEFDSSKLLREFAPQIEKTSKTWYIVFSVMFAFFLFGIFGLYTQIAKGHDVTGMRDNVVW